jgi:hypothetical protein
MTLDNTDGPKTIIINGRKLVVIGSSSSDEEADDFERKPGSQSSLQREMWKTQ